jgi:sortase (surface protein transpeptidase)
VSSSPLFGALLVAGLIVGVGLAAHSASSRWATPITLPPSDPGVPVPPLLQLPSEPVSSSSETLATPIVITATPFPAAPALSGAALPHSLSPPDRLIIPQLDINSTWLPLGYLANGTTMDSPPGPADLGWYTFSDKPGGPGNAVFAGHVDWHTGAPALFEHLDALTPGAEVDVSRDDGVLVSYRVISSTWYDYRQTNAAPLIAPTSVPTLTLITCGGSFDQSTREYDKRLVVRATALSS